MGIIMLFTIPLGIRHTVVTDTISRTLAGDLTPYDLLVMNASASA